MELSHMDNDTIRVGVIGAGDNTRRKHIPGFKAIDGVALVGVANRSRESGQRVADEFDIPRVYDEWRALVTAPEVDAVCVGTWPYLHRPAVLTALEHDKHVLTEARMALNAHESREMLAAARAKPHLVTQVVPAPFSYDYEQTAIDMMADGYIGDLLSVELAISQGFVNREAPYMWRHDRALSGYNAMLVGAWYECLMRMVGPASSVSAVTRVNVSSRADSSGQRRTTDIPDHVDVLSELTSGALMRIRVSEVLGHSADALSFFGTEGTLLVDFGGMNQYSGEAGKTGLYGGRKDDAKLAPIEILPEKTRGWRVEEEFINAIRGIEPVARNTFEIGVQYMEFTEAVTRSAQSRRTVYLPL